MESVSEKCRGRAGAAAVAVGVCPLCHEYLMAKENLARKYLRYEIWCVSYCCPNRIRSTFGRDREEAMARIERRTEKGEISVAVILLLTFLSGVGITVIGVNYDHALRREEAEKARKALTVEQSVDWDKLPNEGEIR